VAMASLLKAGVVVVVDQFLRVKEYELVMKLVQKLCLAGLCAVALFAFGVAGSASAVPLLFVPHSGKFPYHFAGLGGAGKLEPTAGALNALTSGDVHVLVLVLSATLFDAGLTFLGVKSPTGEPCWNTATESNTVSIPNILGHLGFAHHENVSLPAALLLLPKVHFFCKVLGSNVLILVHGSVIGQITAPALNTSSTLLLINFKQTAGVQLLRSFLFGNTLVSGLDLLTNTNEGAFELAGQEGHVTLHALPGEGTFLLVAP
jgi:hypothetical protein